MAYLLQRLLTEAAARQPQRPAVASDGCLLTYHELDRLSNKLARALLRLGVAPGDRVAILAPKSAAAVRRGLRGAEGRSLLRAARPEGTRRAARPHRPGQRRRRDRGRRGKGVPGSHPGRRRSPAARCGSGERSRPGARRGRRRPGPGRGPCAMDRGLWGIGRAVGGGTGNRDRPRLHPVHVGIDRHPEGGDDLPSQLAHVCRLGGGRCGARRAGPRLQSRRRCTSTCRSSTSSPPAAPPRA